ITYIDQDGNWHRVSKGAPEQIVELCNLKNDASKTTWSSFSCCLSTVNTQTVPEKKTKESPGGPWVFVGLRPLFDPPRLDSAETIRQALHLATLMITGDQLAIAKETAGGLEWGRITKIIKGLEKCRAQRKHICGMTGDGVNDPPALKRADIGIRVADATMQPEPGLSVIVSAVLTSRAVFQGMKNYTIYDVSITIRVVLGFMLLALLWKFDFSPFMDKVKPSPMPDSWKLKGIFLTGIMMNELSNNEYELTAALYLQVSIVSQALIFVTRSRSWSYVGRPGLLLLTAFMIAQLVSFFVTYSKVQYFSLEMLFCILISKFVLFLFDEDCYPDRSLCKLGFWDNLLQPRTAFTTKKDYGRGEREAQWEQRTVHGLQPPEQAEPYNDKSSCKELSEIAEQAKKWAEVARLRELHTVKGHVESVVKLKGLDIDTIQQHYTL
ncbi:LOW QUALITY PROTEIN: hypothetical protein M8C21_033086, partial [Ambrosia artemisiifolia]